jgi:hypothetical protein
VIATWEKPLGRSSGRNEGRVQSFSSIRGLTGSGKSLGRLGNLGGYMGFVRACIYLRLLLPTLRTLGPRKSGALMFARMPSKRDNSHLGPIP